MTSAHTGAAYDIPRALPILGENNDGEPAPMVGGSSATLRFEQISGAAVLAEQRLTPGWQDVVRGPDRT